jgi:hypothetical protein
MRSRRTIPSPVANAAGISLGALADEWLRLGGITQAPGEPDDDWDARVDVAADQQARIVRDATAATAASPGAVADKLRLAVQVMGNGCDYTDRRTERLIESAIRDLRTMGGADA